MCSFFFHSELGSPPVLYSKWSWNTVWWRPYRNTVDSLQRWTLIGGRTQACTRHTERLPHCSATQAKKQISKHSHICGPCACQALQSFDKKWQQKNSVLQIYNNWRFKCLPYCIRTLQLHGPLLELTIPLSSHLVDGFAAGTEQWKDHIWGRKCTWEGSSHPAYLSHDHTLQSTVTPGEKLMGIITQDLGLLVIIRLNNWLVQQAKQ